MSRKHFKAFAEAISQITDSVERIRTAQLVAAVCKQANSNFDYYKFMYACGVQE